jgi:general L-amino acid transport system permease protein
MPKHVQFLRDERFLSLVGQLLFLALLATLLGFLARNLSANLRQQGLELGFSFFKLTSGFDIGETLIPYNRSNTYFQAFLVGLLNTASVSLLGIFLATGLGVLFGIARLSSNFLVQQIARFYIEFLRNIPLLVLLIFWYLGVFLKLPRVKEAIILPGPTLLTNRGVAIPWGLPTDTHPMYLRLLGIALILAAFTFIVLTWQGQRSGRMPLRWIWAIMIYLAAAVLGWQLLPDSPYIAETPAVQGLRIVGGKTLSPEFMALLSGLAIYTSAFIADVVRAGIQSVSRGQVEAAKSLGLTGGLTLRLVVFPQAMRVIVPPLTSQYLNLTKNSSQ